MKTITLFIALAFSISIQAQWTTDLAANTLTSNLSSEDMKAVSTSDGQTYIVYWEAENLALYLQVLDTSGNKMLGDNGHLITNTIPMNTYTVTWSVVVDNEDNLYVGVTATGDSSGHVYKLDIAGNHLWSSEGVALGSAYVPTILPLETGEAIISWIPGNQALMQKYDTSGNPMWDVPQTVTSGSSKTAPANLFELSGGDYVLVFHTYNYGVSSTLFAQKYDSDGVAQWDAPTQLSNKETAYNKLYSGLSDNDTVYFGYYASTSTRFDSFLQKINPDGTIPWGINGKDFDINETNYELETQIAFSEGSQYIWSICNYSDTSQTEYGEYIQKFDKETGERLFTENAKEIYAISANQNIHTGSLHIVGNKPLFLLSKGMDNGVSPTTLEVVLLDENGDFIWAEESKPIATYTANKKREHLLKPKDGQAIAVFIEDKSDGFNIYAQNIIDENLLSNNIIAIDSSIGVTVYPNPTERYLSFKFNKTTTNKTQIKLYNSLGKLVFSSKENRIENNRLVLDLNKLPLGVYTYSVLGNDSNTNGLIIISK